MKIIHLLVIKKNDQIGIHIHDVLCMFRENTLENPSFMMDNNWFYSQGLVFFFILFLRSRNEKIEKFFYIQLRSTAGKVIFIETRNVFCYEQCKQI